MALHALRRRSSKNSLQVAPLAHDLRMPAAEREAGAAVVDFDVGTTRTTLGLCLVRQQNAEPQNH